MRKTKRPDVVPNIEYIIKARLSFQTTKNRLFHEHNIQDSNFITITSKTMLENMKTWKLEQRNNFFILVGGNNYLQYTQRFFENLAKV